jgi:hypothetical protein
MPAMKRPARIQGGDAKTSGRVALYLLVLPLSLVLSTMNLLRGRRRGWLAAAMLALLAPAVIGLMFLVGMFDCHHQSRFTQEVADGFDDWA